MNVCLAGLIIASSIDKDAPGYHVPGQALSTLEAAMVTALPTFCFPSLLPLASWEDSTLPEFRKKKDKKIPWRTGSKSPWCSPGQGSSWHSPVSMSGLRSQDNVERVNERKENQHAIKELMIQCWLFLVLCYFPVVTQTALK